MYMNGSGRPVAVVRTRNPYINATSKSQQAARSIRMRVVDGGNLFFFFFSRIRISDSADC
jgi:hypothetical protein